MYNKTMLKEDSVTDDRLTLRLLIDRIPIQKRRVIFALLASAAFLLIIAFLAGGVTYAGRSFLPISRIEVTEILNMERADVLARAGIENQTYWMINKTRVRANLLAIAAIKGAVVEKRFPDTLVITLEARKPAAMVMSLAGGAGVLQYVDETGKVFEKGKSVPSNMHLPIITDANMQNPYAGAQFHSSVVDLLKTMSTVSSALLSHISEIEIDWKITGEYRLDLYDLIVYPKSSSIRVRMNAELDDAYISKMLLAVKTVEREYNTDEIDYRSNDPVFIPKGGFH